MKYLTAILLLTMNSAIAAPVTINWSLPTEREDGTYLDISEIAGTNIWFHMSGSEWGPFLVLPEFTSIGINTGPNEFCMKLSTDLFEGPDSAITEWLCLSNTPEGE